MSSHVTLSLVAMHEQSIRIEHNPFAVDNSFSCLSPLLTSGVYGIAGASLVGCEPAAMMSMLGSSFAGPVVKLAVSFPLIYHYLGAVRHIVSGSCNAFTGMPLAGDMRVNINLRGG